MVESRPRVLAVTLARGGSKAIPNKNIAEISGFPLIYYTIKEVKKSSMINRYIVSTDCRKIQKIVRGYDVEAPFLRPPELSTDTATSADALRHAVLFCENQEGVKYDIVIELMATNPFKTVQQIDEVILKHSSTKADSVIGMSRLYDHHPARIKKIVNDKIYDFAVEEMSSRRQDLKPEAYIRNGSIYSISRDKLVNNSYRYGGDNSRPYIMPDVCLVNIDTPIDLVIAESIMSQQENHERSE